MIFKSDKEINNFWGSMVACVPFPCVTESFFFFCLVPRAFITKILMSITTISNIPSYSLWPQETADKAWTPTVQLEYVTIFTMNVLGIFCNL